MGLGPTILRTEPCTASVILADTVGFIRDLPHQLVDAFHATLEETKEADLLLHVIDVMDPNGFETIRAVEHVLADIGAGDIKTIRVFNKIDLQEGWSAKLNCLEGGNCKVWVSAATGAGLDLLREAIATQLHGAIIDETIELGPQDAKLRAQFYAVDAIVSETILDTGGWRLHIRMSKAEKERVLRLGANRAT